ncbi:MAG: cation transporter substrate-binding protein [Rhodospirillales bacterium]|nr:cation transporter substrate-binding protein [Rhodospirillales bacterium]
MPVAANAVPLNVVAAENVYGDLAEQLGGDRVSVISILNNPAQDPHLFEAGASAARALAAAQLAIYNGADYDPWMPRLLAVTGETTRRTIIAGDLAHITPGDNPHLWYDLAIIRMVATAIADNLAAGDPGHAGEYAAHLRDFDLSVMPLLDRIADMRGKYAGTPVTATEPVFDYMARAIGLQMRNPAFQLAVMNDTEPSARDVAAFEDDLKGRKVKVLLYNTQATGALSQRMRRMAEDGRIPVVGVSETEPPGSRYQDWMSAQLDALDKALSGAAQ